MAAELLRWFEALGRSDVASAGGKGASLGELIRAGVAVPPGFVVTTAAYRLFMDEVDPAGELRDEIESLSPDDLPSLSRTCARVRERIAGYALSPGLLAPLVDAHRQLAGANLMLPVAVRSSATAEDSADASFAGLQDTYLWVRGADAVCAAVRACWASWFNDESVSYRRQRGLPEQGMAMAVVVQQMVNPRCSGVMFSRSPTTGDRSVVAIEGSWGLGSAIVSGEVTPDRFVVNKVTGVVVHEDIAEKALEHVPDPAGSGVLAREVQGERRKQACLDKTQVAALARLARHVEKHYGCAQDMEWALAPTMDEAAEPSLFLLQSRPETVWANRESQPAMAPKAAAFEHVFSVLGGQKK